MNRRLDNDRTIRAPRGSDISAKSWLTEAPLRMLMNNLDPDVAERPSELVVYGGIGRAARDWESFDRIVASLRELEDDQTLLVQSGKPVGVFRTHADAPRVLIANSNIVPHWATLDHFNQLLALISLPRGARMVRSLSSRRFMRNTSSSKCRKRVS